MKRSDKLKAGKFDVDTTLVLQLLQDQFPEFAGLPVKPLENDGWDNWTFRLGPYHKVRLPSDTAYAAQAKRSTPGCRGLRHIFRSRSRSPLRSASRIRASPGPGRSMSGLRVRPSSARRSLTGTGSPKIWPVFLKALWGVDCADGPPPGAHNFHRGGNIIEVYGTEARFALEKFGDRIDLQGALDVLDHAAASAFRGRHVWLHGDIAVGNLLVQDGRLSAVIDFGSSAVGDPACDLVITWLFFDGESRTRFRDAIAVDEACWARARAWALWKAAIVLAAGSPVHPEEAPPIEVIETVVREHRQQFS